MLTIIISIFIFLLLILVHESGHFFVAKAVGIRVNEFSIGMGPEIFHKVKNETKYVFRLIPAGGYVSMEGEDEESDDPDGFSKAPTLAKILVVAAGAIMNFILAILIFMVVYYGIGSPLNIVDETIKSSPAALAGLESGDLIKEINGDKIDSWNEIIESVSRAETGESLVLKIERDNQDMSVDLKTTEVDGRVVIGIKPMRERNLIMSFKSGFIETGNYIKMMAKFFFMLLRGQVSTDNLSGPVGVVGAIGSASKLGFYNVLLIMGAISVNLGFFNLLPIPALDGGRLFFLFIELLRGKPMDPDKEGLIHMIGFFLLISLMIFVSYKDIIGLLRRE